MWYIFSLNIYGLKHKNSKTVLNAFIEIVNEANRKQINFGLFKEENFTINLCKNDWAKIIHFNVFDT